MKKKVNVFGKSIHVFVIALFAMALVSAALVPYLSNTITGSVTVDSPISIVITDVSAGSVTGGGTGYTIALFGGEEYTVNTNLIVHAEVTGHIAESVIFNFDGDGITVEYFDVSLDQSFPIPGCQATVNSVENTYYYIGNPSDNLPVGTFSSITTVTTALNLEPKTYNAETRVILESDRKCAAP